MKEHLLNETEAAIHLGITKELLFAYVRNAPKKYKGEERKLISKVIDGQNYFAKEELDGFDLYLKEPWSNSNDPRPPIPSYIVDYLKAEIGGKCPISEKGYPLDNAHIIDYSLSKSHHHHNLIRISKEEHFKFDNSVFPKDLLVHTKSKLIEALRVRMSNSRLKTEIITYLPNIDIENIKGRNKEIKKIFSLLEKGEITNINGIGGIGKTSLAQLYSKLYYHEYDYFLWIEFPSLSENLSGREVFISGLANNFLVLNFLGISLDNNIPIENLLELVLKKLDTLPGRKLWVLDNVPNAIQEFAYLIPKSEDLNVICTSRHVNDEYVNINIDVLNESDAKNLFYSYYHLAKNDVIVEEILALIGSHTLTVELVSKLATKRNLSLERLHQILKNEGVNVSTEAKVTSRHDTKRKPTIPFSYLCSIFDLSNLNTKQTTLIRNLSIIGRIPLSFDQIQNLLSNEYNDNELFHLLMELHESGWISKLNNKYHIHQMICEVLVSKLNPTSDQCKILIDKTYSLIEKSTNVFSFHIQRPYIEVAERIINLISLDQHIEMEFKFFVARHHGFSGNYERYNKWYRQFDIEGIDLETKHYILLNHANVLLGFGKCQEAIEVFEKATLFFSNKTILSLINGGIAHAYTELGNFKKAIEIFEVEYINLEFDLEIGKSEKSIFLNNYSKALSGIGKYERALELGLEVLNIRKELLEENHPLLAQSYNNLGVDYESTQQLEKALEFHRKALTIREQFDNSQHPDLAESYHNIASIYFQQENLSESKIYFQKALEIRELVFPDGTPSLVLTYCCFASLMIQLDLKQAIHLYEKAFNYYDALDFQNNDNAPVWLISYGIALFENENYKEAFTKINLAIMLLNRNGDLNKLKLIAESIKERIKNKLGKPLKDKIGRNDLCTCGSGFKYKVCCGLTKC